MPLDTRLHGKNGQVLMDPTGGTSVVAVANLNQWTLDASAERVPATCFGDTNIIKLKGLPDFSGTLGGFWNAATSPALFAIIFGTATPRLRLVPNTEDPTVYFTGLANIDGGISVDAKGAISFSSKWDAAANWEMES